MKSTMRTSERQGMVILSLNAGSSSLKAALFRVHPGTPSTRIAEVTAGGIGQSDGFVSCTTGGHPGATKEAARLASHMEAVNAIFRALENHRVPQPDAIGHRIVRSPPGQSEPALLTKALRGSLETLRELAPLHVPRELDTLDAAEKRFPRARQALCFDNHFFSGLPSRARRLPLPRRFDDAGIQRIGYHGLSYEYIMERLPQDCGRTVIAHLGNGASMAAVRNGRPLDTTMGYTPTGGLMMGTRTGDLDPGVLIAILRREHIDADALERLVERESGLAGLSGGESSMKSLVEKAHDDNPAAQAIELFCYTARKHLGAMFAVLGGIDTLVFTGGIGEHAPTIRAGIVAGLGKLGLRIDPTANEKGEKDIGAAGSTVRIQVIPTDEDQVIARHTARLIDLEENNAHV